MAAADSENTIVQSGERKTPVVGTSSGVALTADRKVDHSALDDSTW